MELDIGEEIKQAATSLLKELRELASRRHENHISPPEMAGTQCATSGQAALLEFLDLVVHDLWPDRDTANSIEISFGFLPKLRDLPPGKTLILTGTCPNGFSVEMKRLPEAVDIANPDCAKWCLNRPNYCCAIVSSTPTDTA